VDTNDQNNQTIKEYTHKIKLKKDYAKHATEAKIEDHNFIITIPIEGKK
jgi:hypothetical protein